MEIEYYNILSWIYCPNNNITINDIVKHAEKYNIPYEIIIMKYIQLLCFNGIDNENIMKLLSEQMNIITTEKIIEYIRNEQQHITSYNHEKFIMCEIRTNKKNNEKNNPASMRDKDHIGYPLVDKYRGRPCLDWGICYHKNCMKNFYSQTYLRKHLKEKNCLTHCFHKRHEQAILNLNLTPEKIIAKNIRVCPSQICDKQKFNTPHELIHHLILLGIPPFWKEGMDAETYLCEESTQNYHQNNEQFNLTKNIYRRETCVCCDEVIPELVFLPCFHSNLCTKCYDKLDKKSCPECRININSCLPY